MPETANYNNADMRTLEDKIRMAK